MHGGQGDRITWWEASPKLVEGCPSSPGPLVPPQALPGPLIIHPCFLDGDMTWFVQPTLAIEVQT